MIAAVLKQAAREAVFEWRQTAAELVERAAARVAFALRGLPPFAEDFEIKWPTEDELVDIVKNLTPEELEAAQLEVAAMQVAREPVDETPPAKEEPLIGSLEWRAREDARAARERQAYRGNGVPTE